MSSEQALNAGWKRNVLSTLGLSGHVTEVQEHSTPTALPSVGDDTK